MKPDSRRRDPPGARARACVSSLVLATLLHWNEGLETPTRVPSAGSTIAVDVPPRPLPGQTRPDAAGRCPRRSHVPINGGCWKKLAADLKDCAELEYVYKGACYVPAIPPSRPSISNPTNGPAPQ
jgi:hypothetical protein